jgi:ribosome-associated protein
MRKHEEGEDDGLPDGPSKSQVKRELLALQDLAQRLTAMSRTELEPLGLSEATRAAIGETARIKDQRARRRHFKRIAKLLNREDMDAAHALVDEKGSMAREAAARHHRVERWRERLIEEGDDALAELLDLCPGTDRQQLRQLMRAARKEREQGQPDAPRKLFRFLREIMKDTDLS